MFRLRRYVKKCGNGGGHGHGHGAEHYILLVHGSGANSGNWVCLRYYFTIMEMADRVLMWNYLKGPFYCSPNGCINELGGWCSDVMYKRCSKLILHIK